MKTKCKATKADGQPCSMKAGPSGYCQFHDPAIKERKIKEREKSTELCEVLGQVERTCNAKGWSFSVQSQDKNNGKYATVSVSRWVSNEHIEGIFEITVKDDGVKISGQGTSFHKYGFKELHEAVMNDIDQLSWIAPNEKSKPVPISRLEQLKKLLAKFNKVARQLQRRYDSRSTLIINDEYDVQDLLHALLTIYFDDIRPEECCPSYAGASSRVDFVLKDEKIVIETKMISERLTDKKVGEELIIDIQRYQTHPDCQSLVCFVYDPRGLLKNPTGLERDLSKKHDKIEVIVIVNPKE